MKKDFFNNIGLITLFIFTLFFIKLQIINNAAYAGFQRSFSFLINVILFLSLVYVGYACYKHFLAKKKQK
ncbi:hypothetical protein CHU_3465 [Cytophaga hutchinsonii ATCC 33406]|jgi:hypothetical protein|uniref:Uncharacterized protein n=1 Tax=Cytophaga hutchinsonii (strain ATCC 33406 / DSM 1761 / CIP 103989 / NBRC 15051 / NCIMB 9469 / D465) TaxID=269798 RepID=A0A6N4SWI8_CYTH3|nr:hypothetical protein CHU_3465 [Cytophaga hutchinsonii ATCC 33406]SFX69886.1 hypothetical protein SAMN04487930_10824 [Cytophaga hutchinsonii ATCC 33406]